MIKIKADAYNGTKEQPLPIGRMGEKNVRTVIFDINHLREIYGEGTWNVVFQRPGLDELPYDVSNKWTNPEGYACWDVDDADTGIYGYGKVELRYYPFSLNQSQSPVIDQGLEDEENQEENQEEVQKNTNRKFG